MIFLYLLIGAAAAVILGWGYYSSNVILRTPREALAATPDNHNVSYQDFFVETTDHVRLSGWFVPAQKPSSSTIFILHGWGANRSDRLPSTIYLSSDYNLVYFDFRNHGTSGDSPTSLTCLEIEDFKTVLAWAEKTYPQQTQQIAVYGFSMGAAVAISAAASIGRLRAVAAESPFTSFESTVERYAKILFGAPKICVVVTLLFARARLGFNPEGCSPIYHVDKIAPRPLFILQGNADVRMPASEGFSLYQKAKDPKSLWTLPGADHGHMFEIAPEEYRSRLTAFFQKVFPNS